MRNGCLNIRYTSEALLHKWSQRFAFFGFNQLKVKPGSLSVSISSQSEPQWLRLLRGRGRSYCRIACHRASSWVSSLFANSKQLQCPSHRAVCLCELWFMVTLSPVTVCRNNEGHDVDKRSWLYGCWPSVCILLIHSQKCSSFIFIIYLCVPTAGIVRLVTVGILLCEPPPRAFFPFCSV